MNSLKSEDFIVFSIKMNKRGRHAAKLIISISRHDTAKQHGVLKSNVYFHEIISRGKREMMNNYGITVEKKRSSAKYIPGSFRRYKWQCNDRLLQRNGASYLRNG